MQKNDNHVDFSIASFASNMHSSLIKAIGCVTGVIEVYAEKHQLSSMTSKRRRSVKRLNVYWWLKFNKSDIKEIKV